ncbi:MAG: tetratricopeptide repeat protein [Spirochaetes bacterium]|nr:tetratricopeptide repeat protein [Spirochaetota bacterium]
MPRLQDIERFKQDLRPLGHEEELLAKWGEQLVDISPPEQGLSEDLSALIAPQGRKRVPDFATLDRTPSEPSAADEFDSFLDGMNLDGLDSGSVNPEIPPGPVPGEDTPGSGIVEGGKPVRPFDDGMGDFDSAALLDGLAAELEPSDASGSPAGETDLSAGASTVPDEVSETGIEEALPSVPDDAGTGGFELPEIGDDLFSAGSGETGAADTGFGAETDGAIGPGEVEKTTIPPDEGSAGAGFDLGDFDAMGSDTGISTPEGVEPAGQAAAEPADVVSAPEELLPDLGEIDLGGDADFLDLGAPPEAPAAVEADSSAAAGGTEDLGAAFGLGPAIPDLDKALESLESGDETAGHFSLDDGFGGDFSISALDSRSAPKATRPAPGPAAAAFEPKLQPERQDESETSKPVSLSDGQVDALQDSLLSFPLNLRLAVEDIVANEKGSLAQRERLVWMLVEGASPSAVADQASRVLKRPIELPKGFEKRTGAAFEAERGSFPYIFVHNVLPILRIAVVVGFLAFVLGWLAYNFVYRPVYSNSWYARGYERVRDDSFTEAEEDFARADRVWPMKAWYFRYARGYLAKRRYELAAKKYAQILARWPSEDDAAIEWATFEKDQVFDYKEAARILKTWILDADYYHRKALMLLGDSYLDWAEEDPAGDKPDKFEEARLAYAALISKYGQRDPYLERMLRYFIRLEQGRGIDKSKQIITLKEHFTSSWRAKISAVTLTDLGGYLVDRDMLQDVRKILMRSAELDPGWPETHYHIARYYRNTNNPDEERKALANAVATYDARQNLRSKEVGHFIDSLNWSGEFRARSGEYVTAESFFERARAMYEKALAGRRLARNRRYGSIYANLADIYYSDRYDYAGALNLFDQAAENGYETPEIHYKRGYIYYSSEEFRKPDKAVEYFYRAGLGLEDDRYYLDYAIANAMFIREDWFAARSYYSALADRLRYELDRLEIVSPQTRDVHHEMVQLLMFTDNNLGVSLYRASERTGNPGMRGAAMSSFAESLEMWDSLKRDYVDMLRPDARSIAYTNIDAITHPKRGVDIVIEKRMPRSMDFPQGWDPDQDGPEKRKQQQ